MDPLWIEALNWIAGAGAAVSGVGAIADKFKSNKIASLEKQLAEAKAKLAKLKAQKKPKPPKP